MLINVLFSLVAFLGGYVLNGVKESLKSLIEDDNRLANKVQAIEVLVAGEYVRHDALKEALIPLSSQLNRIEIKLDHKADK
jgi:hypothetical protein